MSFSPVLLPWTRAGRIVAAVALLVGCAAYTPGELASGTPVDALRQRMGEPTARHALPSGGTRLEYARGPAGLHTYMIDLDGSDRVLRWVQVLDAASFARLQPGWSREQVRRELGTPTQEQVFNRLDQRVWSYRWNSWDCTWFQVTFSLANDLVHSTGSGPDPRCEVNDDRPD
jgi:hypothetical protein